MSQNYNVITLKKNKDLNIGEINGKSFLYSLYFINTLKRSLIKKGILVLSSQVNFATSTCYITLKVYYKTVKIVNYKNKINSLTSNKLKSCQKLSLMLNESFNKTKNKLGVVTLYNINKNIKKILLFNIYLTYKRYVNVLFSRRFNLFIDFTKMTALFISREMNPKNYLYLLSQIFRLLSKKKHSRFLFFLKNLFSTIIKTKQSSISGIKFIVNGKLQGKTRAGSSKILVGSVPIQSIEKNIAFGKTHVYTLYGAFGFKMWVNYI
jgi:hypothetical protein